MVQMIGSIRAFFKLRSRIIWLNGRLGVAVLGTEAFASRTKTGWTRQGEYSVKGIDKLVEVYQPPQ